MEGHWAMDIRYSCGHTLRGMILITRSGHTSAWVTRSLKQFYVTLLPCFIYSYLNFKNNPGQGVLGELGEGAISIVYNA